MAYAETMESNLRDPGPGSRMSASDARGPGLEPVFNPAETSDPAGEPVAVSIRRVAGFLRRWIVLVGLMGVLGVVAAVLFQSASTPCYIANAQVIIDPRGLQVMTNDVNPRTESGDANILAVENEMRVLKSSTLLDQLIDEEKLEQDPEFARQRWSLMGALRNLVAPGSQVDPTRDRRNAILQDLDGKIAVRRTERSFVVDVFVTTAEAEKSARLANRLVELYIAQAATTRSDLARRAGASLTSRLDELRRRVRDAEDKIEQFRTANGLAGSGGQLVGEQQLTELNRQLVATQARAAEAKVRTDQLRQLQASQSIESATEAVQSPAITQLRNQIAEVSRRRANLSRQLGPNHPEMIAVEAEARDLQRLLREELRRIAQVAQNDYQRAHRDETALQAQVDALSRGTLAANKTVATLRELERDADASRSVYNGYLVRSKELAEQTTVDSSNIRQITVATPPLRSSNAPNSLVLPIGLVAGLGLGTLLALLAGALRPSAVGVRRDDDLPVFWQSRQPAAAWAIGAQESEREIAAFQHLLDRLIASSDLGTVRSVGVAAAGPGLPTADLAYRLAHSASRQGCRTLLVDGSPQGRLAAGLIEAGLIRKGDGAEPTRIAGTLIDFATSLDAAGQSDRSRTAQSRFASRRHVLTVVDVGVAAAGPQPSEADAPDAVVVLCRQAESGAPGVARALEGFRRRGAIRTGLVTLDRISGSR